jgi:ribosomal protein S19
MKKGPFVDLHLVKKVEEAIASNSKKPDQDLVAPVHGDARYGRI